jgi:hypothetical protein
MIPDDETDPHGVSLGDLSMALFEHNLVGRTDGNGIVMGGSTDPIIRHNIIIENGRTEPTQRGRGICNFSDVADPRIYHNLFWNNVVAAILDPGSGGNFSGEEANDLYPDDMIYGNIDADPLLTDPDNLDFTLQPDSPAIDAGDPNLPGDPDGTVADLGPYYFDQTATAVSTLPEPALIFLGNVPNPFNPATELRFQLGQEGPLEVDILDVRGRLVRNLYRGLGVTGPNSLRWDGIGDGGRSLPSGVYLVSVRTAGKTVAGSVLLLR